MSLSTKIEAAERDAAKSLEDAIEVLKQACILDTERTWSLRLITGYAREALRAAKVARALRRRQAR